MAKFNLKKSFKLNKKGLFLLFLAVILMTHFGFVMTTGGEGLFGAPVKFMEGMGNVAEFGKGDIPKGDEDKYVLKSAIVPPVCPKCPDVQACPSQKKCPPCPACARCPEPSFECKKVPNYNSANDDYLPRPVVNDFSSF